MSITEGCVREEMDNQNQPGRKGPPEAESIGLVAGKLYQFEEFSDDLGTGVRFSLPARESLIDVVTVLNLSFSRNATESQRAALSGLVNQQSLSRLKPEAREVSGPKEFELYLSINGEGNKTAEQQYDRVSGKLHEHDLEVADPLAVVVGYALKLEGKMLQGEGLHRNDGSESAMRTAGATYVLLTQRGVEVGLGGEGFSNGVSCAGSKVVSS